jgi:hypothetical protein
MFTIAAEKGAAATTMGIRIASETFGKVSTRTAPHAAVVRFASLILVLL